MEKMLIHFSPNFQISNDRNLVFSATDRPTYKRDNNQLENHGKVLILVVQLKCIEHTFIPILTSYYRNRK